MDRDEHVARLHVAVHYVSKSTYSIEIKRTHSTDLREHILEFLRAHILEQDVAWLNVAVDNWRFASGVECVLLQ